MGKEKWVTTTKGKHLAGRRKVDTAPEVALRRALHATGARFRLHPKLGPGCTPDLVLPRRRIAVFVDGCFWHGCPRHGRKKPWTGANAQLWEAKMTRNRLRDARANEIAAELGWTVIRVWECEVGEDAAAAAQQILGLGET